MRKNRFSYNEEDKKNIVAKVKELRSQGYTQKNACAEVGVAIDTFNSWSRNLATEPKVVVHTAHTPRKYERKNTNSGFIIVTTPNNLKQVLESLQ